MTSLGIMTLSRGPYNELDKMSLFQDLKLKRRKVDSRCSSDGESVADTSTSSPDLATPLSPKMCDNQPPTPTASNTNMGPGTGGPGGDEQSSVNNNNNPNVSEAVVRNANDSNNNNDISDNNNEVIVKNSSAETVGASSSQPDLQAPSNTSASNSSVNHPSSHTARMNMKGLSPNGLNVNTSSSDNKDNGNNNASCLNLRTSDVNKNQVMGGGSAGSSVNSSSQGVIRSVKSERISSPSPSASHFQQSSHGSNSSLHHHPHHHQHHEHPNSIPSSSANTNSNNNSSSNVSVASPTHQHHHQSSSGSTTAPSISPNRNNGNSRNSPPNQMAMHPSQHHVTVLVNPSRVKAEQLLQHHQTTIVGLRRNSPPASSNNNSHHHHQQQHLMHPFSTASSSQASANHFRDTIASINSTNYTPVMIQTISPVHSNSSNNNNNNNNNNGNNQHHHQVQVQLMHNSPNSPHVQHQRGSIQLSPTSSSSNSLAMLPSPSQLQIPLHLLQQHQQQQLRIKRERSPNNHNLQQASVGSPITSITLSPTHLHKQGHPGTSPQLSSPISPNLPLRHPPIRDAAILFRVKNEAANLPSLAQTQHRMLWGANTRINGVKPEIIGGPIPNLRPNGPNSGNQQPPPNVSQSMHTPPRATPTVIMGESCGVRTMVWGFEPSPQNSSSSPNQTPGPSQNNEEAAQLLLSLGQSGAGGPRAADIRPRTTIQRSPHPLNMERLWAGDYSQLPAGQQLHALNLSQPQWMGGQVSNKPDQAHNDINQDDDDQPLVCMICEDKATGLHYGIITCEGCKGFFKRTVQNRRVYTCVADGTCEITKAQRNRCQYCRFKKCIEQGMVLQAVREDRMPGGRNSGAVYNLYKVKYKKHKKTGQKMGNQQQQQQQQSPHQHQQSVLSQAQTTSIKSMSTTPDNNSSNSNSSNSNPLPSHLVNGTILKTALTNPSEIVHLRHRLDNAVSSSKDRNVNYEHAMCMIQTLIDCDEMEDIATLPHFPEFLEDKSEIGDKLCNIGDSIVHKLVSWTKKLPFYLEIPVEIHTKLLTDKWHELLVLTTAAYQALHGKKTSNDSAASANSNSSNKTTIGPIVPEKGDPEFVQEVNNHLCTLQTCLTTLMGQPISMEQLRLDVGHMVEKMTQITIMFRRIKLKMEEYVCLKVYILLNRELELESIQERYVQVLRSFLQHSAPHNPGRLGDLLAHIPEIQAAASLLLESKMFYVPFVLNSASIR